MFPDLWGWIFTRPLYLLTLKGRAPGSLRNPPRDLWPGDPARGRRILDEGLTVTPDGDVATT
ncbi:MAG: hypothetical protein HYW28_08770 [Rhodospirillales bacterium]|nr:hypothetical protein [Rhodospirillales bacterium]